MAEELIRIKNGLYKPVPIYRNNDGKEIYMFVRIGEIGKDFHDRT